MADIRTARCVSAPHAGRHGSPSRAERQQRTTAVRTVFVAHLRLGQVSERRAMSRSPLTHETRLRNQKQSPGPCCAHSAAACCRTSTKHSAATSSSLLAARRNCRQLAASRCEPPCRIGSTRRARQLAHRRTRPRSHHPNTFRLKPRHIFPNETLRPLARPAKRTPLSRDTPCLIARARDRHRHTGTPAHQHTCHILQCPHLSIAASSKQDEQALPSLFNP